MGYIVLEKGGKEVKIELQKEKIPAPFIELDGEYGHLTLKKPPHPTLVVGNYYLTEFLKKLKSIRITREVLYDGGKGANYALIKFYNKSNEVICEFKNLGGFSTATAEINQDLKDQSIAWFYMNWYQDTHSGAYVRLTGYVTDVDGNEHLLFQGGSFKNYHADQHCWVGVNGGDPDGDGKENWNNWSNRLTTNNFPFRIIN